MFIVTQTKNKTITWPVTVEVPADGGKIAKHTFTGTFKVLNDEERAALFPETPKLDAEDVANDAEVTAVDVDWKENSVDEILKVMTGWQQIVDEHKNPIEFNRTSLLALAKSSNGLAILRGINTALHEIRAGARVKN